MQNNFIIKQSLITTFTNSHLAVIAILKQEG